VLGLSGPRKESLMPVVLVILIIVIILLLRACSL
jgi:hypothetical protein